jgi:N-hydroxyarylamine O-acetyltransferase
MCWPPPGGQHTPHPALHSRAMAAIELVDDWSRTPAPLAEPLLERYLQRIGLARPSAPTLSALHDILWGHLAAFPFENFDALLGLPVTLAHEPLVEKLVDGQRGGYCFEQNILLGASLQALGYSVSLLAARGILGATGPRPRTHLALLIELGDGRRRLVDAGFGRASLRSPLELEPGRIQPVGRDEYRLVDHHGELAVQCRPIGAPHWTTLYLLDPRPLLPIDVEMANHFVATHPASHMKERPIVLRPVATGKRSLVGLRFVADEQDRQLDRDIAPAELDELLRSEFAIHLPETHLAVLNETGTAPNRD